MGHAEVRQVFRVSKVGNIAGCYIHDGSVFRDSKVRVKRGDEVLHTGALGSLKREKDDAAKPGCALIRHSDGERWDFDAVQSYAFGGDGAWFGVHFEAVPDTSESEDGEAEKDEKAEEARGELGQWLEFGASPRGTIALDQCARALAWLETSGTAVGVEHAGAKTTLWWAAMTYVAAALAAIAQLLYLVFYFLGSRD